MAGMLGARVSASGTAHADEPAAPEADTNPATRPPPAARVNLVLVGAAVAVGWYGAAVGTSYLWTRSDAAPSLRIPIAGPYMALAKSGCSGREPDCTTLTVVLRTLLTTLSLVGQTGGLLAALDGAFVPTRAASPDVRPRARARAAHVAVLPTSVGASGAGLAVIGDF